jgi:hypothetical protein
VARRVTQTCVGAGAHMVFSPARNFVWDQLVEVAGHGQVLV